MKLLQSLFLIVISISWFLVVVVLSVSSLVPLEIYSDNVHCTAGFDALRDELGSSRASSIHHGLSLDVSYDEQDMVKVSIKM